MHESFAGFLEWTSIISEAVAIVTGLVAVWREGYLAPVSWPHLTTHRAAVR